MGLELALFGLLALIAVVSAAAMIFQENAVHSALFLILNFGCVALLFLMLDAPFIAMVQIAVYAGAIMVLFLFVIMLLGAEQTSDTGTETLKWLPAAATILGVSLLVSLATPLLISGGLALPDAPGEDPQVRLVHAANAADPVTITIGENEPIDGVRFGDTTNFFGLDAGDYPVTIADADGEVIYEDTVVLEADSVFTIVAYGDDLAHDLQIMVAEDAVAPLNFTFDEILDEDAEEDAEPARVVVEDLALEELFSVADVGSGDWELTVRGSDRVIVFSETLTLEGGEVFTA
ncbi:MAG: NADH-quinone oxidoreductase subunit J, partial [Chloroflexota bacterium]